MPIMGKMAETHDIKFNIERNLLINLYPIKTEDCVEKVQTMAPVSTDAIASHSAASPGIRQITPP